MMRLRSEKSTSPRYEPWLFLLVSVLHLFPLFTLHFFPTVDGAAHTYNATIIKGLITGNNFYESFYEFNKVAEPNWLGHAVLTLLSFIASPLAAEKIFVAICVIALPISFRQLVLRINPAGAYASYLIFPFIYSFMFITGFYNFCLSLPLFFWTLRYWIQVKDDLRPSRGFSFTLLMLLLYFCHIMAFGLTGLAAGLILLADARAGVITFLKRAGMLLLASLPGLLLVVLFLLHHSDNEPGVYLPKEMLWSWITELRPIFSYDYDPAHIIASSYIITGLVLLLVLLTFISRVIRKEAIHRADTWLVIAIVLLAGYFILPDTSAGGGYISIRILYYVFLFFVLWICVNGLPRWAGIGSAVIAVAASLIFVVHFHDRLSDEDEEIQEYYSIADHIEENSTVLPISYNNTWRNSHYSNYLAYNKHLVILENYEASSSLFPVVWKKGLEPYDLLGNVVSQPPCLDAENYSRNTGKQIDYIVQWKYNAPGDSCSLRLSESLKNNYTEVARSSSGNAVLLKLKK